MDQQQAEQLVQEVAGHLQQGANPEEIMQALVQQGVPQDMAQQIVQAAMQMVQGGGEGGQGQGQEGGSVLEAVATEDPELLLAILTEWESLPPEAKQEIMSVLQQGGQGGGQPQGQEQPQEQGMF